MKLQVPEAKSLSLPQPILPVGVNGCLFRKENTVENWSASPPPLPPPPPPQPAPPRLALGPTGNQLDWLTLPFSRGGREREKISTRPGLNLRRLVLISSLAAFLINNPPIYYSHSPKMFIIKWAAPLCKIKKIVTEVIYSGLLTPCRQIAAMLTCPVPAQYSKVPSHSSQVSQVNFVYCK